MQRLKYDRFVSVPSKSNNRASSELGTPQGTVWRGLRRRLLYKPYWLQLLQALRPNDKERSHAGNDRRLCVSTAFSFSGELTFHLSGKVNGHNVRIWSLQNPLTLAKRERLGKVKRVFCHSSPKSLWLLLFSVKNRTWNIIHIGFMAFFSTYGRFKKLHF